MEIQKYIYNKIAQFLSDDERNGTGHFLSAGTFLKNWRRGYEIVDTNRAHQYYIAARYSAARYREVFRWRFQTARLKQNQDEGFQKIPTNAWAYGALKYRTASLKPTG
jgi:hypothetical protein